MNRDIIDTDRALVVFDGAWIQNTTGTGADNVWVSYACQQGSRSFGDQLLLGQYDQPRGVQEVLKFEVADFFLAPHDPPAIIVLSLLGQSQGDLLSRLLELGRVVAAVGEGDPKAFIDFVLGKLRANTDLSQALVGSVIVTVKNTGPRQLEWTVEGADPANSSDRGRNPTGSYTIEVRGISNHGIYWPKLLVKAYTKNQYPGPGRVGSPSRPDRGYPPPHGPTDPLNPRMPIERPLYVFQCSILGLPEEAIEISLTLARTSNGEIRKRSIKVLEPTDTALDCAGKILAMATDLGLHCELDGRVLRIYWTDRYGDWLWDGFPDSLFAVDTYFLDTTRFATRKKIDGLHNERLKLSRPEVPRWSAKLP